MSFYFADDEIKRLIQIRTRVAEILATAKEEEGMTTLVQDGVIKTLKGHACASS